MIENLTNAVSNPTLWARIAKNLSTWEFDQLQLFNFKSSCIFYMLPSFRLRELFFWGRHYPLAQPKTLPKPKRNLRRTNPLPPFVLFFIFVWF